MEQCKWSQKMEKLPSEKKKFKSVFNFFFLHLNTISASAGLLANNPIQLTKPAEG